MRLSRSKYILEISSIKLIHPLINFFNECSNQANLYIYLNSFVSSSKLIHMGKYFCIVLFSSGDVGIINNVIIIGMRQQIRHENGIFSYQFYLQPSNFYLVS